MGMGLHDSKNSSYVVLQRRCNMKEKHHDLRPLLTNLNDPIMLRSIEKTLQGTSAVEITRDIPSVADKDEKKEEPQ